MKNLTEISQAVAKEHGLTSKKALAITRSVIRNFANGIISLTPDSRERVSIADLGSFGLAKTNARDVKRISDGTVVHVPEGVKITYKPAQSLKDHVASGEAFEASAEDAEEKVETGEQKETEIPDINDL